MTSTSEQRASTDSPLESDREQVVAAIIIAVDDGILDADEGGRRLSLAYRATDRSRLGAITRTLTADRYIAAAAESRAARWWALARIAAYAIASAMMVYAVLHGISPTDPH